MNQGSEPFFVGLEWTRFLFESWVQSTFNSDPQLKSINIFLFFLLENNTLMICISEEMQLWQ